jgi:hypothetical protein
VNSPHGWFRSNRSDDALELIRANKNAFLLLYIIASRARWKQGGFNQHGLKFGEAFLGDCAHYGLTEREYRTAKKLLAKWGLATFKPTNKGTIAKLVNMSIFDISPPQRNGQSDRPPADRYQTSDERVTTNNNETTKHREEGNNINPGSAGIEDGCAQKASIPARPRDYRASSDLALGPLQP